jgi:UDP-4-amino-4,6-dideoxy-N-acetyl-beta-L-altrosamine N-acetyltransferase
MNLSNFGVELEPLNALHLETIRTWRNSELVNEFMEYKEVISAEQQAKWFASLDPKTTHYFIIKSASKPIGLIHLNAIDIHSKQAEVGLFIGDASCLGTGITFGASVLLLDLAFTHFQLEKVVAKVNDSNLNAIRYNSFFGFKKSKQINAEFSFWELTKSDYYGNKPKIEKGLT